MPIFNSMNSTSLSPQEVTSSALIGREASEMSVSPAQKRANPSPVPGPSTVMATSGLDSANTVAAAAEIGSTVDEPETAISPDSPVGIENVGAEPVGASLPAGAEPAGSGPAGSVPAGSVPAGAVPAGSVVSVAAAATCADVPTNSVAAKAAVNLLRNVVMSRTVGGRHVATTGHR